MSDSSQKVAIIGLIGIIGAALISGVFALLGGLLPRILSNNTSPSPTPVHGNSNTRQQTNEAVPPSNKTTQADLVRTQWLGLEIWQGEMASAMLRMSDLYHTRIRMKPAPFEIRFPRLKDEVPIKICAWKDKSIFSGVTNGKAVDETVFARFRTMADTTYGGASLMLNNEAHNNYGGERAKALSENQSSIFVSGAEYAEQEPWGLSEQNFDLYLVVFRNLNADDTVDNGEFEFLMLDF